MGDANGAGLDAFANIVGGPGLLLDEIRRHGMMTTGMHLLPHGESLDPECRGVATAEMLESRPGEASCVARAMTCREREVGQ